MRKNHYICLFFFLVLSTCHKGRFSTLKQARLPCINCLLLQMGRLVLPHYSEHCSKANLSLPGYSFRDFNFGETGFLESIEQQYLYYVLFLDHLISCNVVLSFFLFFFLIHGPYCFFKCFIIYLVF